MWIVINNITILQKLQQLKMILSMKIEVIKTDKQINVKLTSHNLLLFNLHKCCLF